MKFKNIYLRKREDNRWRVYLEGRDWKIEALVLHEGEGVDNLNVDWSLAGAIAFVAEFIQPIQGQVEVLPREDFRYTLQSIIVKSMGMKIGLYSLEAKVKKAQKILEEQYGGVVGNE